jgi:hypothetical protein
MTATDPTPTVDADSARNPKSVGENAEHTRRVTGLV